VDVHSHLIGKTLRDEDWPGAVRVLLAEMDAAGVKRTLVLPPPQVRGRTHSRWSDLAKAGKDLGADKDRITKITDTQNQLEANYQKIQDVNKQAGMFKPPVTAASASATASETSGSGAGVTGPIHLDPNAQAYMDEWLAKVHLNQWGQWVGRTGTATIRSAGSPEASVGRTRHDYLWNARRRDTGHSNYTMEEYVMARLRGENPELIYNEPADSAPLPSTPLPTTGGGGTTVAPVAEQPGEVLPPPGTGAPSTGQAAPSTDVELSSVDAQLKDAYDRFARLQKDGKGDSDEARAILKSIEALQGQKASVIRRQQGGQ
jgi:hypothetical protein